MDVSKYTVEELTEALLNCGVGRQAVKRAYSRIDYEKRKAYHQKWQRDYERKKRERK